MTSMAARYPSRVKIHTIGHSGFTIVTTIIIANLIFVVIIIVHVIFIIIIIIIISILIQSNHQHGSEVPKPCEDPHNRTQCGRKATQSGADWNQVFTIDNDVMIELMMTMASMKIHTIGHSVEGRPLKVARIGTRF